jgi:hypothetical protein
LLQAAQPPRDAAQPGQKTGTGAIKGRVLAGNTDSGVASATVYLVVPGPTSPPRAVLTDRSGRFTIDKLPAGSYRLSATPPENTARLLWTDASEPIDVDEGATVTAPEMRLPVGAAVSGRVVDERGEPLANVEVYAMGRRFGSPQPMRLGPSFLRTDDNGRFRLFGLPAGDVIVVAQAATAFSGGIGEVERPAGFVTTYYPDVVSDGEARHITLGQGADIDGIDIRMTRMRTFRITGTVVDSRGLPFATARLGLHHMVNGSGGTSSVSVAADGRFEIRSVLPGSYRIVVGLRDGPFDRSAATEYASVPVDVSDDNVEDLLIATRPGADLTVRVAFEPEAPSPLPANFGLVAWGGQALGFPTPQAELRADSTVLLKGVAGPLVLRPMAGPRPSDWFVKGVFLGSKDITDTPTEFTPADAERVRVVFTLRAATVTGMVTDEAGKPVREYGVILFPEDRAEWIEHSSGILTGTREKDGSYRIRGVRAGRYRIAAIERERANRLYFERVSFLESLMKDSIAITVTENEQRVVDLKFQKTGSQ